MAEIVWSAKAVTNLEDIHHYIQQYSDHYAGKLTNELLTYLTVLEKYPEIGKIFHKGVYIYRRLLFKNILSFTDLIMKKFSLMQFIINQNKLLT